MATWAIGDVHGCYFTLMRLLAAIGFRAGADTLWLLGDLVNRGANSDRVLQWAWAAQDSVEAVLGNHDLTLLIAHRGLGGAHVSRQLARMATLPDARAPLAWLAARPLLAEVDNRLFVHAGLAPGWSPAEALALAAAAAKGLAGGTITALWAALAGAWPQEAEAPPPEGSLRHLAWAVRVMTYARRVRLDGQILWHDGGRPEAETSEVVPWFAVPNRRSRGQTVVFGHWSRLGLVRQDNVVGLDTGCAWGRQLTAWCPADGSLVQQDCDPRDRLVPPQASGGS